MFSRVDSNSLRKVSNISEMMKVQKKNGKKTQFPNYMSIKDLHLENCD